MLQDILIVGGYGTVGNYVVDELLKSCHNNIIIAGRNKEKAERRCNESNRLSALALDIGNSATYSIPDTVSVVITCLTPVKNDFAIHCIKQGFHYVDISPSSDGMCELESLQQLAKLHDVTCILGAGIAPGLSTLLANTLVKDVENDTSIQTTLMLGLGEKHGSDGIKWMLNNLNKKSANQNSKRTSFESPFASKSYVNFPSQVGKRNAYTFPLADGYILTKLLNTHKVSTYFCYNSKLVTWMVHLAKVTGVFSFLDNKRIYNFFFRFFKSALTLTEKIYSDAYAIHVQSKSNSDDKLMECCCFYGNNNSLLTGNIAAYVATEVMTGDYASGIYYMGEMFEFKDIVNKFGKYFSVTYSERSRSDEE